MILYFIRKPFEHLEHDKRYKESYGTFTVFEKVGFELLKPIIGCVTCFSSFWGVIVFYLLHHNLSINTIICCVISAFLNTMFYNLYERI